MRRTRTRGDTLNGMRGVTRRPGYGRWVAAGAAVWLLAGGVGLQHALVAQQGGLPVISSQMRQHARGQNVVPLYRGWFKGADGRIFAAFEYLNRNSSETLDIPLGPDNNFTPGPADRGQPTHFLPGHRAGVFAVPLPGGSTEEISWTLRIRGEALTIPSNLGPLYEIEGLVDPAGSYPGNTPPVVQLAPDGPSGQGPGGLTGAVTATVGEATALRVWATDDGLPPLPDPDKVLRSLQARYREADPDTGGVTVAWSKYRGPGTVSFADAALPVVEGVAETTATFDRPGEYMLRALVRDGSRLTGCCWTNGYLRVTVHAAGQ